jgi:CheY-like chemotaxis protein
MAQKILIVEDHTALSDLLAVYLRTLGYRTSQAGSSAQGISKALAERPDLIITDLHLPDMTAVEATEILKQNPLTSDIPIVVLTAMTFGDWKSKALKAGVAGYLLKPISAPDLAEIVHRFTDTVKDRFLITLPRYDHANSDVPACALSELSTNQSVDESQASERSALAASVDKRYQIFSHR